MDDKQCGIKLMMERHSIAVKILQSIKNFNMEIEASFTCQAKSKKVAK